MAAMSFTRFRQRAALSFVATMLLATMLAPAARAQQTATISVSAVITSGMSISVCDTTANFGNGLNAFGASPTQTDDQVIHSARGNTSLGQGTIYIWKPSCSAGEALLQFDGSVPFQVQVCATENTGTSTLSIAQGDLGLGYSSSFTGTPTYDFANSSVKFSTSCRLVAAGAAGSGSIFLAFTLRIDLADLAGTFNSTTTWVISG